MLGFTLNPQKRFAELGEREILALAITLEEEDGRIYRDFAEGLRETYPGDGQGVRRHGRGGERPPADADRPVPRAVRRAHPAGPARGRARLRAPQADLADPAARGWRRCGGGPRSWSRRPPTSTARPPSRSPTPSIRKLLVDLAEIEVDHASTAHQLEERHLTESVRESEAKIAHRAFVLQYVQPGLAGLMDGSVSTLAPLFAAAFATGRSWDAFLVGLAASIGAGISMGFAEALSDDGSITGRGHPWLRGLVCGLMTTLGGARPYPAVPDPELPRRHHAGRRRGAGRAVGDRLGPRALHGHAVPAGGVPGRARWCAGVRDRHPDRQRLSDGAAVPPVRPRPGFVLVLATALGPFAMQVFLPALPAIQADFGVSAATAQLVLQPLRLRDRGLHPVLRPDLGPARASPRPVRRPASSIFGGSLLCAAAAVDHGADPRPHRPGRRWLRRAGADAARSSATSTASTAPPRVLAYVTMAMVAAPMVAPVLGGLLADLAGWRSVFVAGAAVGLLILVAVHGGLPETAQRAGAARSANPLHGVGRLLRSTAFMGYALQASFSIAVFYAFLAAAPFLMLTVMHRPASEYGLFFILVSGAFMVGNFVAGAIFRPRRLRPHDPARAAWARWPACW